jgi:putative ABC transport system permease protein
MPPPNQMINLAYNVVAPDYFRTLGMPLLRGRDFTSRDSAEAPRVVIVNDTLARRFWPDTEPVGKRLYLPRFVAPPPSIKSSNLTIEGEDALEVIGVAKTGKYVALSEEPRPMMYWPLAQSYGPGVALHVRAAGDPRALTPALRDAIRSLDPFLPVFHVRTLEEQRSGSLFLQRMAASMLGAFGGLGLLLAALGIYGVMAYSVSRRTREIGIRMALGARVADVLRLVLREGSRLVILGLVLGLGAAFAATRVLQTFLFGISANDPLTYLGVSLLLLGVALLACWLPARRAAKVDPIEALRCE